MDIKNSRPIIAIDEEKCDGCGLCVPGCAEGAIQIVNSKAKLIDENRCDGLGHCLGHCPRGAITIIERGAAAPKHHAGHIAAAHSAGTNLAATHTAASHHAATHPVASHHAATPGTMACGCPGAAERRLTPKPAVAAAPRLHAHDPAASRSQLGHWPVQLHLLPIESSVWDDADVLIAADCVGFAMPDFHDRLLAGKTLAIGCPKLDEIGIYAEKLQMIFERHEIRSVTVAHMEVPCCASLVTAVRKALDGAGRGATRFTTITVGVDGVIKA